MKCVHEQNAADDLVLVARICPHIKQDFLFFSAHLRVTENHLYKHCSDVCNDIILMPQIFEVVLQHIWGMVGNVLCCFVENLTDFPSMVEF